MNIKRRELLQSIIAFPLLLTASPAHTVVKENTASMEQQLSNRLLSVITDKQSASKIGSEYLKRSLSERNAEKITDEIFHANQILKSRMMKISTEELKEIISKIISSDFQNSRVVSINGWVLSETEARLYALAHLSVS